MESLLTCTSACNARRRRGTQAQLPDGLTGVCDEEVTRLTSAEYSSAGKIFLEEANLKQIFSL